MSQHPCFTIFFYGAFMNLYGSSRVGMASRPFEFDVSRMPPAEKSLEVKVFRPALSYTVVIYQNETCRQSWHMQRCDFQVWLFTVSTGGLRPVPGISIPPVIWPFACLLCCVSGLWSASVHFAGSDWAVAVRDLKNGQSFGRFESCECYSQILRMPEHGLE
jgi:hypothetical protein